MWSSLLLLLSNINRKKNLFLFVVWFFIITSINSVYCLPPYEVPKAKIEVFYPRGFQVSIPADEGSTLFAFHGKLNEEFDGLEAGHWAKDILKVRDGRFTFVERQTPLKIGDILYYWTYVIHNGLGYREDDGKYVVEGYVNGTDGDGIMDIRNGNCKTSSSTYNNGKSASCSGQLLFEENFDGNRLSSNKWKQERRFTKEPDYEFVVYLINDDTLKFQNGILTLKPKFLTEIYGNDILHKGLNLGTDCTGEIGTEDCSRNSDSFDILPPITTPQFTSKGLFSFKYGKIEIRAKLPNCNWAFPQIFLNPVDNQYGKYDYSSGQMRVALVRGDRTCDLMGGAILSAKDPFRLHKMCTHECVNNSKWSDDYHTYTLIWKPDAIEMLVDGQEYCKINANEGFSYTRINDERLPNSDLLKSGTKMAPFDHEFYITLGYGVGGHKDFPDDNNLWSKSKPWTNLDPRAMTKFWRSVKRDSTWNSDSCDFKIDHVRVYAI